MIVLGVESSCDDTSVAIISDEHPVDHRIKALFTYQQTEEHRAYQGVVPEIAARGHLNHLPTLIQQALSHASLSWDQIDGIAATIGPGLIGGVLIGSTLSKTIAMALEKPFIGIHHLEGHLLVPRLQQDISFPFLGLLASGGHTQLVLCHDVGNYTVLGKTRDDALGECFDKAAKVLQLDYPGGVSMERLAAKGHTGRFLLPRPLTGQPGCDFSFSGLKTAIQTYAQGLNQGDYPDLAMDFHDAVADVLVDRVHHALAHCARISVPVKTCVFTGGVSANHYLRQRLGTSLKKHGLCLTAPPLSLCTDNGAMIAWAGLERLKRGWVSSLDMLPRPRWSLEELKQEGSLVTDF